MPELSEVELYLFRIYKLPPEFLAFAPRISKLDLILSLDIPLEPPQGHLGELLRLHGTNYRTTEVGGRRTEYSQKPGRSAGQFYGAGIREI